MGTNPDEVKERRKESQRRYREKHRDAINARARERRKDPEIRAKQKAAINQWKSKQPGYLGPTRQALVDYLEEVKSNPCVDCGGTFPTECMDLDHVRGVKVASVSKLVGLCKSLNEVQQEIEKCDLVCANCHRIRTRRRYRDQWELK